MTVDRENSWARYMRENPLVWDDVLAYLRETVDTAAKGDGCDCMVCGERAKWNKRSISKKQARALLNLYRHTEPGEFKHSRQFADNPGDGDEIAKTRYWELAVPGENTSDKKLHSGNWKLTDKGRRFVEGAITIQKYVWVYRAQSMLFEGPEIRFRDCLRQDFDIREVLEPGPGGER